VGQLHRKGSVAIQFEDVRSPRESLALMMSGVMDIVEPSPKASSATARRLASAVVTIVG
jgi:hypothetical protein